jgi:hypothetical protein
MSSSKLRLIHSNENSDKSLEQRNSWGFENATQLQLFEEKAPTTITFISTANCTRHMFFEKAIKNNSSKILDTRIFPDFFPIFDSTQFALHFFAKNGIEYIHHPIKWRETLTQNSLWEKQGDLLSILKKIDNKQNYINHKITVLISNEDAKTKSSSALDADPNGKWQKII